MASIRLAFFYIGINEISCAQLPVYAYTRAINRAIGADKGEIMKHEEGGVMFDTAGAEHIGMLESHSIDRGEVVQIHLYRRTPEGDFFFHHIYPPLVAIEVGMLEEIEPVMDRDQLVEWAECHTNTAEMARRICTERSAA